MRENKDEIHAFSHLPFGFGTRMCLGKKRGSLYKAVLSVLYSFFTMFTHIQYRLQFMFLITPKAEGVVTLEVAMFSRSV